MMFQIKTGSLEIKSLSRSTIKCLLPGVEKTTIFSLTTLDPSPKSTFPLFSFITRKCHYIMLPICRSKHLISISFAIYVYLNDLSDSILTSLDDLSNNRLQIMRMTFSFFFFYFFSSTFRFRSNTSEINLPPGKPGRSSGKNKRHVFAMSNYSRQNTLL